jgi:L-alanine-DL-glutamate epimerase-like enolase superfamily enzyme
MNQMRIKDVQAIPLEKNLDRIFQGGTYEITSRYTLVTEVWLENGVCGRTFGGDEVRYQKDIAALINGPFRDMLVGQQLPDVERHWNAMFECTALDGLNRSIHTLDLANRSVLMQAIAAVDIAQWDALGKALQLPVYRLLGGFRDRVPIIAIGGYYQKGKGLQEFREELRHYKGTGMAGMKLKVGRLTPKEDAERVRFAREVVGENFMIACDANQAWTVDEAIDFCRCVQGLNVRWFEEPVRWFDQLRGLAQVRTVGGIPVVAGQGEISRFGCRDLMLAGAVDILNVDATIAGGVTEWRRAAAMAGMMNIGMAHHEEPQVALHLLASVPNGLYVEIFPDPERDPLWVELPAIHPRIEDGYMYLPQEPGFGIPLRLEIIERYRADAVGNPVV